MLGIYMDNVRKTVPLIHNITNYVTVNDVANILLACGASPIMSDEPEDVVEITSLCCGLNINIGTLQKNKIDSMLKAGKKSRMLNHTVLLDPVGAGFSSLRTRTALQIMEEIKPDVIRGNISEIKALAKASNLDFFYAPLHPKKNDIISASQKLKQKDGINRGVDANITDRITEETMDETIAFVKAFSEKTKSIIAVTGTIDLVSDGKRCYVIRNGRPEMSRITGTGCQLSGMMTAFLAANPKHKPEAAAAAVCAMGLAGEIGWNHMKEGDGNATYRNRIIDAIYNMDGRILDKGARYEIR